MHNANNRLQWWLLFVERIKLRGRKSVVYSGEKISTERKIPRSWFLSLSKSRSFRRDGRREIDGTVVEIIDTYEGNPFLAYIRWKLNFNLD